MATETLRSADGQPMTVDRDAGPDGAPTILMIHGWTCRRAYWQDQQAHLAGRFPLLAPDLPGHGDTTAPDRPAWTLGTLARDIRQLVEDAVNGPVILLGHSMGGAVALEAARMLDDRARGVILADTFVIDYGGLDTETQESLHKPFRDDFAAAMAWLVDNTSTDQTPEPLKDRLKREMAEADPAWALPVWRSLLAWQPETVFPEVPCPIHAINGKLVPGSARRRCAPYLKETVMPKAGHFLQMEDPAGFNRELDAVLKTLGN